MIGAMIPHERSELIAALSELARRYPHWRLGQLVGNIAGWADQELWELQDEEFLAAARAHLDQLSADVERIET